MWGLGGHAERSRVLSLHDDWEDEQPSTTAPQARSSSVIQQHACLALLNLVWLRFCASVPESILVQKRWPLPGLALTLFCMPSYQGQALKMKTQRKSLKPCCQGETRSYLGHRPGQAYHGSPVQSTAPGAWNPRSPQYVH